MDLIGANHYRCPGCGVEVTTTVLPIRHACPADGGRGNLPLFDPALLQGDDRRRWRLCETCPEFQREAGDGGRGSGGGAQGGFCWCGRHDDNHGVAYNCPRSKHARYTARLTRQQPTCGRWGRLGEPESIETRSVSEAVKSKIKLILATGLSPGDVMTLTAAVESVHAAYPGQYVTDVRSSAAAIWEHNPHVTPLADGDGRRIELHYPAIHQSNQVNRPFLGAYTENLGFELGRPLALSTNRPHLYLSPAEKSAPCQVRPDGRPLWLVNAGTKSDFPLKQWPVEYYQEVVDRTAGRIQWAQIGEAQHDHPRLSGVVDLVGRTTTRELIVLAWHCAGGLGPVTFLQHLLAAWQKPYVCLAGGREPLTWITYPLQHTLHALGAMDCCRRAACWKSKPSDCARLASTFRRPVGQCMAAIRPEEVLLLLDRLATAYSPLATDH